MEDTGFVNAENKGNRLLKERCLNFLKLESLSFDKEDASQDNFQPLPGSPVIGNLQFGHDATFNCPRKGWQLSSCAE